jgi:hypothetical protein
MILNIVEPVRMCYNGVFGYDTGGEENQETRIKSQDRNPFDSYILVLDSNSLGS